MDKCITCSEKMKLDGVYHRIDGSPASIYACVNRLCTRYRLLALPQGVWVGEPTENSEEKEVDRTATIKGERDTKLKELRYNIQAALKIIEEMEGYL